MEQIVINQQNSQSVSTAALKCILSKLSYQLHRTPERVLFQQLSNSSTRFLNEAANSMIQSFVFTPRDNQIRKQGNIDKLRQSFGRLSPRIIKKSSKGHQQNLSQFLVKGNKPKEKLTYERIQSLVPLDCDRQAQDYEIEQLRKRKIRISKLLREQTRDSSNFLKSSRESFNYTTDYDGTILKINKRRKTRTVIRSMKKSEESSSVFEVKKFQRTHLKKVTLQNSKQLLLQKTDKACQQKILQSNYKQKKLFKGQIRSEMRRGIYLKTDIMLARSTVKDSRYKTEIHPIEHRNASFIKTSQVSDRSSTHTVKSRKSEV